MRLIGRTHAPARALLSGPGPLRAVVAVAALLLLPVCASEPPEPSAEEAALIGIGIVLTQPSGWNKVTPVAGSISIPVNGSTTRTFSYSPSCSGLPGTASEFAFFVKPGDSNLLINFMGGGACWHAHNCTGAEATLTYFPHLSIIGSLNLEIVASRLAGSGVLSSTDTSNPFRSYTKVFIPYCTGDIHWGSRTASYTDPVNGQSVSIQHRGFDNFLAVLSYLKTNYPSSGAGRVVVSGQSAGGYGALYVFPFIKETYLSNQAYLINDSAAGVTTSSTTTNSTTSWGVASTLPDWINGISAGTISTTTLGSLTKAIADHYPSTRFGQLNTTYDGAQRFFYNVGVLIDGGKTYVGNSTMWGPSSGYEVPDTNSCTWVATRAGYATTASAAANYRSFTSPGEKHVLTMSSTWHTVTAGSTTLPDWLTQMVTDSSAWATSTCTSCEPPVTKESSPGTLNCP